MSRFCAFTMLMLLAALVIQDACNSANAATILFKDTFDNTQDASFYSAIDFGRNQEIDQSYRQTGTYANTTYTHSVTGAGTSKVNNAIADAASAGMLVADRPVGINHNFNGADAVDGFHYSAVIQRGSVHTDTGNWIFLGFGYGAADNPLAANGLLLQWNGAAQFYKGNSSQGAWTWMPGGAGTSKHKIDIYFTDSVDSNPFNGSGSIVMDVFVNGVQVDANGAAAGMSHTAWGGDPTDNFIWIMNASTHGGGQTGRINYLDNLTLTNLAIPEPSGFALAAMGLLGICTRRMRRS